MTTAALGEEMRGPASPRPATPVVTQAAAPEDSQSALSGPDDPLVFLLKKGGTFLQFSSLKFCDLFTL